MRVLASADLHGSHLVYEWLLLTAAAHHVDAIVLAGDLLGMPDGFDTVEAAQEHDARMTAALLARAEVPVLYMMGNDDLVELNSSCDNVQSIHGRSVECGSFTFVGYQYALPFMGGTFEKPDNEIERDLIGLKALMSDRAVFVSHSPMHGVLDTARIGVRIGSVAIQKFLAENRFRAHIHGHCHEQFGRHGHHFNVASALRRRAMIIDLDVMEHQVVADQL
jgi:Icc-related predicted phosphoesterase